MISGTPHIALGILVTSVVAASVRSFCSELPTPSSAGRCATLLGAQVNIFVSTSVEEINLHLQTLMRGGPTVLGMVYVHVYVCVCM